MRTFLGIDVGAVSTDLVLLDENNNVLSDVYLRTQGQPIKMIKEGLSIIKKENEGISLEVIGIGTTGSGRVLAGAIAGADIVKNEITAHSVAALLAKEEIELNPRPSSFHGFELVERDYQTTGFECDGCPNHCEVIEIMADSEPIARWGDRCGKWSLGYQAIR
jgi:hypothetical protein